LEWGALEAEQRLGDLAAARESREHRRLFQRLLADSERSLITPVAIDPMEAIRAVAARYGADDKSEIA
jgi:hypothetical protein